MTRRKKRPADQRRFGAHMSIAGGLHLAFERAEAVGCDCFQVFVKNQRQWQAPLLSESAVHAWEQARAATDIGPVLAHGTYLVNLANPDKEIYRKSIHTTVEELERCDRLGISHLIIHPGSHLGEGEAAGLKRIARALDEVHRQTAGLKVRIALETTAGQGTNLGHRFEHLAEIIDRTRGDRLDVCVDTCHSFAAGYDLSPSEGYERTMAELEKNVGRDRVVAFHLNDSLQDRGAKRDRHTGIGQGKIGRQAFVALVNDPRWAGIPMILETPKGTDDRGRDLDKVNLARLRRMIR